MGLGQDRHLARAHVRPGAGRSRRSSCSSASAGSSWASPAPRSWPGASPGPSSAWSRARSASPGGTSPTPSTCRPAGTRSGIWPGASTG
ncbi:MAG: hypothetical protein MZV64_43735 [Ignavibacteriales bacterium]|nr:hypothetical protein [Ignavibacteriales bacterium]